MSRTGPRRAPAPSVRSRFALLLVLTTALGFLSGFPDGSGRSWREPVSSSPPGFA